jgi:prepilin-type N-terminal cleavage/methylation domain-containing protein
MLKNLKNKLNKSEGFTLVELIVVIAIMVILIALLVPNVIGYISSSQTTANLSAAKSVYNAANTAVVNGKASTGGFPTDDQLVLLMNGDKDSSGDGSGTVLVTVPTGTSATIYYHHGSGEVTCVAASTGSTAVTATAMSGVAEGDNTKNIAIYDPKVSGNAADHTYADGETDPLGDSATLIKCEDGKAWTK